nr:MAG TPA: hypothetical protein [Caudoviricetes sp.]
MAGAGVPQIGRVSPLEQPSVRRLCADVGRVFTERIHAR